MDGLKSPIYPRSRLSWVAERIQREKWPEADPQLAGVKVSKRRYSISHPFHNPFPSVRHPEKVDEVRCEVELLRVDRGEVRGLPDLT